MEVIYLPGYVAQEKLQIAEKILVPKERERIGLDEVRAVYILTLCHRVRVLSRSRATLSVRSLSNIALMRVCVT